MYIETFRVVLTEFQFLKARIHALEGELSPNTISIGLTPPRAVDCTEFKPPTIKLGSIIHLWVEDGLIGRGPIVLMGLENMPALILRLDILLPLERAVPYKVIEPHYLAEFGLARHTGYAQRSGKLMDPRDARIELLALHVAC